MSEKKNLIQSPTIKELTKIRSFSNNELDNILLDKLIQKTSAKMPKGPQIYKMLNKPSNNIKDTSFQQSYNNWNIELNDKEVQQITSKYKKENNNTIKFNNFIKDVL
jgi:hypothetical protein